MGQEDTSMLTKSDIAQLLSTNPDKEARASCATFSWLPQDLMELLSRDKNSVVRECLARNPSTPEHLLRALELDIAPHVQDAARYNLNRRETDSQSWSDSVNNLPTERWYPVGMSEEQIAMIDLALSESLTEEQAKELLEKGSDWVRAYLAFPNFSFGAKLSEPVSQRIGPSILDTLLNDESGLVRAALARNPLIPVDFYEQLASDEDRRVIEMLARNPSTPLEVLQSLTESHDWRLLVCVAENSSVPL
jgi:hypothetical protein